MISLRPYQQALIDDIRSALTSGYHSVCAVLGCGGGKSIIQGSIAAMATARNNNVLFLVHCKELCQQITGTFTACGVDFNRCSVMMVQAVVNVQSKYGEEAAMKELMGMMTEAAQRYCEATKGDEKCEVLN